MGDVINDAPVLSRACLLYTSLEQYDYPIHSLSACLDHLDKRMEETDFPHEIGIFLGYPLSDVLGFINNETCCCMGAWKVYSPKKAEYFKSLFKLFDHVDVYKRQYQSSLNLEKMEKQFIIHWMMNTLKKF